MYSYAPRETNELREAAQGRATRRMAQRYFERRNAIDFRERCDDRIQNERYEGSFTMAHLESRNQRQCRAGMLLVGVARRTDCNALFCLRVRFVDSKCGMRMAPMMRVPMVMPVEVRRVDVIISPGFFVPCMSPKYARVCGKVVNRRACEPDHAVQHGETNGGQIVQPSSWHRRTRAVVEKRFGT